MTVFGYRLPMWSALFLWLIAWEAIGHLEVVTLIPPLSSVLAAMCQVLGTKTFLRAIGVTLEAFEASRLVNDLRFVENGAELMEYLRRQGKYADPERSPVLTN